MHYNQRIHLCLIPLQKICHKKAAESYIHQLVLNHFIRSTHLFGESYQIKPGRSDILPLYGQSLQQSNITGATYDSVQ